MQTFNGMFAGKIPQITAVTEKRRKAVKARIAEHGKEAVMTVFRNILQSPFLLGRNDNGWTADFDWIFKPTNFIKILEENYNNGNQRGKYQQDAEQRKLDSAIAIATTVRDAAAKRRKELEAEGVIDPLQRT